MPVRTTKEGEIMNLTQSHLDFYRQKKTPTPQWAVDMLAKKKYPWSNRVGVTDIHSLINSQEKGDRRLEACNLCSLIRRAGEILARPGYRPSPDWPYTCIREYVADLAFFPCSTSSKRRTAYARKWHNKLNRRARV